MAKKSSSDWKTRIENKFAEERARDREKYSAELAFYEDRFRENEPEVKAKLTEAVGCAIDQLVVWNDENGSKLDKQLWRDLRSSLDVPVPTVVDNLFERVLADIVDYNLDQIRIKKERTNPDKLYSKDRKRVKEMSKRRIKALRKALDNMAVEDEDEIKEYARLHAKSRMDDLSQDLFLKSIENQSHQAYIPENLEPAARVSALKGEIYRDPSVAIDTLLEICEHVESVGDTSPELRQTREEILILHQLMFVYLRALLGEHLDTLICIRGGPFLIRMFIGNSRLGYRKMAAAVMMFFFEDSTCGTNAFSGDTRFLNKHIESAFKRYY